MPKPRVMIYGDSLFLAGVRTILEQLPSIELLTLGPKPTPHELINPAEVERLRPDMLLFDAACGSDQGLFDIFRQNPTIRLVGLNAQEQTAAVTQWDMIRLTSPGDLTQLILDNQS